MSVYKNWKLFHTVVCPDLDQPGCCLWVSLTGSELCRVEADGFNGPCDDFISLSVSKDRESLTGGLHWTESMLWFKDLFFYTVGVLETTVMSV